MYPLAGSRDRDRQVAEVLVATFAGRYDAYVDWTGTGYVTVRQPLTADVVVGAIRCGRPVSAFFLNTDSCSHVAALDFDRPDGWELAGRVGSSLWESDIPAYSERSRGGRAHVWIVTGIDRDRSSSMLPGAVLRFALKAALAGSGLTGAPDIELRPGADRLWGPESLGNALRLPTMPHRLTGERHPLCDPRTGQPLGPTLGDMLINLEFAAPSRLLRLAEQHRPPHPPPVDSPRVASREVSPIDRFNGAVGVSEVLRREFGVERAAPGRTIRCPVHDDRSPSLSIARDDTRAWCHAPGCDLHGPNGAGHDAYSIWVVAKRRAGAE